MRLAFVEREQQSLGDGVGAIVLFQHLHRVLAGWIAQNDGVWLQMHGDVIHVNLVFAGLQVQREFLPHDGEILVIDGEGRLRRLREETSAENKNANENTDEAGDDIEPPWKHAEHALAALEAAGACFGWPVPGLRLPCGGTPG